MKVYKKEWKTILPGSMDSVWHFFSRPENLEQLMPEKMGFKILSEVKDVEMYEGLIILYKVAPFMGINMRWCTEITKIKKHQYFIDEQRFGPYAMWHHEHHFKELPDGKVEMIDRLHYAIPMGVFGRIANALVVEKKIEEIFAVREQSKILKMI